MGKASQNKKVQRVARAGGGRKARRRTGGSMVWPTAIGVVVVLGVFLVVFSRNERQSQAEPHPRLFASNPQDHWHIAYGFYTCDSFAPNLPADPERGGIHTHADGLIHVEAVSSTETGKNATLEKFIQEFASGLKVTSTQLELPGGPKFKNGDKCHGKPGKVQILVWKSKSAKTFRVVTDPKKVALRNLEVVTIAFAPEGAKIPQPASVSAFANPNAGETATTSAPGPSSPTTAAPGATTPPTSSPPATSPPTTAKP